MRAFISSRFLHPVDTRPRWICIPLWWGVPSEEDPRSVAMEPPLRSSSERSFRTQRLRLKFRPNGLESAVQRVEAPEHIRCRNAFVARGRAPADRGPASAQAGVDGLNVIADESHQFRSRTA